MDTLRLGLVGVGKIARDQHIPSIEQVDHIELVALVNHTPGDDIDFTSLDALFESDIACDAISLTTPPVGRGALARQALAQGCHVMLEKPPAATIAEISDLVEFARTKQLTLFASWHSREAAGVSAAADWLRGRTIRAGALHWREDIRVWHPGQDWILDAGGLGVFDPAINAFSILTQIVPEALRIDRPVLEFPENRQSPIAARCALVTCETGATISCDLDFLFAGNPEWTIAIETDDGSLELRGGGADLWIDGDRQTLPDRREYTELYRNFQDLVGRGESDVDLRPLQLVADAFLLGERRAVAPFSF